MPLDGIVVRNIVCELESKLTGGRIDKISQPESDEIIISVRRERENYKLLLSSSPTFSRVHLTGIQKQNPISAPMFCMVLRKHLSGGKIVKIEQYNIDRIVKIYIEGYDELGVLSNKILISEIMGRYSNLILVNEKTNEIIDSIRHITPDMSSYRQILPGIKYIYPPAQDKINLINYSEDQFISRINSLCDSIKLGKFITRSIDGINIFAAREICFNAGLDEDMDADCIKDKFRTNFLLSIRNFAERIVNLDFSPCIYYSKGSFYDFYSLKLNYLESMDIDALPSISKTIEDFYFKKDKEDRLKQKSSDIYRVISNNLDRCYKKLSIQDEKLLECEGKDTWRLYGDLIMANLYNIKCEKSWVELINFYDENSGVVKITMDMQLTAVENAQAYYKKYNKEKSAETATLHQKEDNLDEISYLDSQLVNLRNCTEDNEINEIRNELSLLGYIKIKKKSGQQKQKLSRPMHYLSSDGFDIYAGKNNVQNDYLTTKLAEPSDIWLHTKKIPGSHVIIKSNKGKVSEAAISDAAAIAAYYSKARESSNVPVDYTERKNVKKPSGSKPGMVVYYTNKTFYVTPQESYINTLKKIE